jgi:hypothetical protein
MLTFLKSPASVLLMFSTQDLYVYGAVRTIQDEFILPFPLYLFQRASLCL